VSDPPTSHKPLAALYWSLLVTTALAAAIMVATFWLSARNESDDEWVLHTLAVRSQLAEALTLVQRAESGQHGYLLTGNEAYLVSYDAAVERLPAALDQTSRLVDDDQQQQQTFEQLRQLIADKLMEMNETVEDRKAARSEAALEIVNTGEGRRTMDEIRQLLTAMDTEEAAFCGCGRRAPPAPARCCSGASAQPSF
jgi:CHASE3 domain sensor protein